MDDQTSGFLELLKRRGTIYIVVPAIAVALVVAFGVAFVLLQGYGRMIGTGLNGLVAGSIPEARALDDPLAVDELQGDLEALLNLGSFALVEVVGPDGTILASTEGDIGARSELEPEVRRALEQGSISARIRRCDCGDIELMVTAPLTTADSDEPFAVIRGHRPFALFGASFLGTILGFVLVILFGASVALWMVRMLVTRAQQEIEASKRAADTLSRRLDSSLREIEEHSLGTLQALIAAVDARDTYTAQHSLNVADHACTIARSLGVPDEDVRLLERAALLHDVGKIGLAEDVLSKPTGLTASEFDSVREHSAIGAHIIETIPFLYDAVPIVRHHHEHWDGGGYPEGRRAEDIPLLARILAVADAFDAMTTDRSYRPGLPMNRVLRELEGGRGTQFDPAAVDALLALVRDRVIVVGQSERRISA